MCVNVESPGVDQPTVLRLGHRNRQRCTDNRGGGSGQRLLQIHERSHGAIVVEVEYLTNFWTSNRVVFNALV